MDALKVPSFAKLNLGLEVLGIRADGYHELRTLFQTVDLHDDVVLRPRRSGITVRCAHPGVPEDETNLAFRAARDLARYARVKAGVAIEIEKRIPVAGGLGGGSSNAASVLLALDHLWGLGLGRVHLHPLAVRLGADVPFFLYGGTALGVARGEEVYPLHRQVKAHTVVVDAGIPVSTAAVFRRVDSGLTPRENSRNLFRFVASESEAGEVFSLLSNELEPAACEEAPELARRIRRIRSILAGEGAALASLSGSGSSFFGLFDDPRRARRAGIALKTAGFRAFHGRTLTMDQYRKRWSRAIGPD